MKNKLTVIALKSETLSTLTNYFDETLSEYLDIVGYLDSEYIPEEDSSQVIVFSGEKVKKMLCDKIVGKTCFISARELDYRNLNKLTMIKPFTNVYVVNDDRSGAINAIESLKKLEINQLNYIPFYPGAEILEGVHTAVAIGEMRYVPHTVQVKIDIGTRIPSISAIIDICNVYKIPPQVINAISNSYMSNHIQLLKTNHLHLQSIHDTEQVVRSVFNNSKDGMCLIDHLGMIKTVSDTFLTMMNLKNTNAMGSKISELLIEAGVSHTFESFLYEPVVIKNRNGREILINTTEMNLSNSKAILIYSSYTSDINAMEVVIRKNKDHKLNKEKYDFSSYLTQDNNTLEMIEKTKRLALNESTILIQGESGTGKEILAQSIHNASSRRHQPFVPVNFAGMQSNLLESELFGYVDGAFTGALKGGSKGLFEMAHSGTIFFDEIGDAPMSFQVRLLRVLQEQEIRRIGDSKRIPIDVRVIAATNKDLFSMIKTNEFREDLFYRICVIPIDTIPVRDRPIDILYIMNYFIKKQMNDNEMTVNELCTTDVVNFFEVYNWTGNVREIINVVTYLVAMKSVHKITLLDLPKYMFKSDNVTVETLTSNEYAILSIIKEVPKIGRKNILNRLKDLTIDIKEGQIRTYLKSLNEMQLIKVNNTRGGCEITNHGEMVLNKIK